MSQPSPIRRLVQNFFQGLIILAPIAITAWAVVSLFNFIDGILPNLITMLFGPDMLGYPGRVTGLGFLLVIVVVILVGYISSTFIVSKLVELFDKILERTPGVRIIYSTVRDFFEAFAGNKRRFDRAVLVSIESPGVWRVGFITNEELSEFGLSDHIAVYVPHSYAFSGVVYLVPKDRVRVLSDVAPADAMKFAISGGVTEIDDEGGEPVESASEPLAPTGKTTA
ncbi:MAG: DUF502 domain-containing protein [Chitinophagia bacterium]|nr:DUF502 domain-containing protein [Chitinophagia bacterium]